LSGTIRVAAIRRTLATLGRTVAVTAIRRTLTVALRAVGVGAVRRLSVIATAGRSPVRGSAALVRTTVILTVVTGIAVAGS
jgi:hypothetical protein